MSVLYENERERISAASEGITTDLASLLEIARLASASPVTSTPPRRVGCVTTHRKCRNSEAPSTTAFGCARR